MKDRLILLFLSLVALVLGALQGNLSGVYAHWSGTGRGPDGKRARVWP